MSCVGEIFQLIKMGGNHQTTEATKDGTILSCRHHRRGGRVHICLVDQRAFETRPRVPLGSWNSDEFWGGGPLVLESAAGSYVVGRYMALA